jgi:hypothetical protein
MADNTLKEPPTTIITTWEEVKKIALTFEGCTVKDKTFLAQPILDLILEIKANGEYPYNSTVIEQAAEIMDIPPQTQNGESLSWMVYWAQDYGRDKSAREKGYMPFKQEVIDYAFENGLRIHLGGDDYAIPKKVGEDIVAMKFRSRSKHYPPVPWSMVRLVDKDGNQTSIEDEKEA